MFKKQTPYEKYQKGLEEAKLDQTALGQQWLAAGKNALQKPVPVTLPFKETGYFPADKPMAAGYQFTVQQGQKVAVKVQTKGTAVPQVFLDLFETRPEEPTAPKQVANADSTAQELEYEIEESVAHVLRVQPELLRSGQYTVTIEAQPVLAFPVQGKDGRAIQSFWGQDRDAGARKHEGIDIFAPRNTPVIASTEGVVSRVSTTPIGGKVVWLQDPGRNQSLYYAHLDSQLVQPGQRVAIGDTLGLMGNTGNAKTTAPHLHFGIYKFGRGAVDPFPYVFQSKEKPAPLNVSEKQLGQWTRVAKAKGTVRQSPDTKASIVTTLEKNTPVQVVAGTSDWYRVVLANGQQGFMASSLVEPLDKPLQTVRLRQTASLLETSHAQAAAKRTLPADTSVQVLARMEDFWLVRVAGGTTGWLEAPNTPSSPGR
ncbi:peptidoglycan DD-metalloendopeptidase family protein [Nibribacter ruber]|uniref:Peptidoglycan DD-metalloendopeptidase family protein n=1 Tax=Nibribacter ruber TaxID=2698458 RepID=A0A6P1P4W9_9BACT|nr:peptidoglycan DD-metalloendopeptidase family protein [Nibribacter ruber]